MLPGRRVLPQIGPRGHGLRRHGMAGFGARPDTGGDEEPRTLRRRLLYVSGQEQ
jgi:hypothetical protein